MARKRKTGLPPGTMVYTGQKTDLPVKITYTEYDEKHHKSETYNEASKLPVHQSNEALVQWYDIRGLHDTELIQQIAIAFGVHTLAMEDIVDVHKRPSYEEYRAGHFISFKSFEYDPKLKEVISQTISLFFGKGFVLSFQEHEDDVFKGVRERISTSRGRIRQKGSDYLAYAIIDGIVDRYYQVIDSIEETLEEIESTISNEVDAMNKGELHQTKINLIKVRKSVVPLREALNQFIRSESDLIDPKTEIFLRDVYDHTIQIVESTDTLRDILGGLQDLYISEISLKMNKIMQVLTIVTAVFVPLSFLTGLYGMNFEVIPELKYQYGYFILWGVMLVITIGMFWMFKHKKWL
ncbi:MAG: magnesium/cobalt transporter CorA [Saprospiraceae bacterium]|nr:magnesium/cobalt transporter CorA [Saprospiraceae bacterium]